MDSLLPSCALVSRPEAIRRLLSEPPGSADQRHAVQGTCGQRAGVSAAVPCLPPLPFSLPLVLSSSHPLALSSSFLPSCLALSLLEPPRPVDPELLVSAQVLQAGNRELCRQHLELVSFSTLASPSWHAQDASAKLYTSQCLVNPRELAEGESSGRAGAARTVLLAVWPGVNALTSLGFGFSFRLSTDGLRLG